MLRNRSRAVSSKQALMSDQTSFLSPTRNSCSPISSLLNSPRFFNGFLSKNVFDAETMSPTSILDSKNFLNPFRSDRAAAAAAALSKPVGIGCHDDLLASANKSVPITEAIGLGLIDSIADEKFDQSSCKFINRMALFGSKLKVRIPDLDGSISPADSPKSPADFGMKTRTSQLSSPAKELARQLSLKEMEKSEDYTCVIKHGPNPKTRHIYDDCILETCCLDQDQDEDEDDDGIEERRERVDLDVSRPEIESIGFRSFCHACKALLPQDKDIFMYRGEKAFCSQECRCQQMIFDDAF